MNFIFLLETKVTFFLVWDLQILKLHFGWTFSLAKRLSLSHTHTMEWKIWKAFMFSIYNCTKNPLTHSRHVLPYSFSPLSTFISCCSNPTTTCPLLPLPLFISILSTSYPQTFSSLIFSPLNSILFHTLTRSAACQWRSSVHPPPPPPPSSHSNPIRGASN